jgi:hypothetical protein
VTTGVGESQSASVYEAFRSLTPPTLYTLSSDDAPRDLRHHTKGQQRHNGDSKHRTSSFYDPTSEQAHELSRPSHSDHVSTTTQEDHQGDGKITERASAWYLGGAT